MGILTTPTDFHPEDATPWGGYNVMHTEDGKVTLSVHGVGQPEQKVAMPPRAARKFALLLLAAAEDADYKKAGG